MAFLESLRLIISISFVLFVPGYFLFLAIFGKLKKSISSLEQLVISFFLSIFWIDFFYISISKFGLKINFLVTIFGVLLAIALGSFIYYFQNKKAPLDQQEKAALPMLSLNKKQLWVFLLIFLFSVIIRTLYVAQGALPQTTDLGHHMYWAKEIKTTGHLPAYQDAVTEPGDQGKFIIGEHLMFAAVGILSGIDFVSAMPVSILLAVNIISILAMFIAAYWVSRLMFSQKESSDIAILSLVIVGIFYAISSPAAKYVSGGVIGNIIGNLLIPLVVYFLLLATYFGFNSSGKKSFSGFMTRRFALLFVLASAVLAYTHHLSAFVFLYVFFAALLTFFALGFSSLKFNWRNFLVTLKKITAPFFSFGPIAALLGFLLYVLLVYTPTYLDTSVIETAVGAPSKSTRIGLGLLSIAQSVGPWRFFYALVGIAVCLIILYNSFRNLLGFADQIIAKTLAFSVVLSWFMAIFLMTYAPALLKVDILSSRIANYLVFPSVILSAIAIYFLVSKTKETVFSVLAFLVFIALFGTGFISGLADISDSARDEKDPRQVQQVFQASQYLAQVSKPNQIILKDHIYLAGDSWIKLFLMRGYKNPLSRTFSSKYTDPTKNRETCTWDMMAAPDSETAQQCFAEYSVDFVMVSPDHDAAQFERSSNFSKIFASKNVAVFQRNNNSEN